MSRGDEIRPASAVNVVGRVVGDPRVVQEGPLGRPRYDRGELETAEGGPDEDLSRYRERERDPRRHGAGRGRRRHHQPVAGAKEKRPFRPLVEEICSIVPGDVSLEVVATDFEGMVKEGEELAQVAPNVVVKVPMTADGLKAVKYLSGKGIRVNQTLCFSAPQALLSAKAGVDLHQPVPRPPRRHRRRRHGPDPRHLRDLPQLRLQDPGAGRLHPQPAARHRRGQGRARTCARCRSPCCRR